MRHEEGAAQAAAGQAKLTGRLAVCCGTISIPADVIGSNTAAAVGSLHTLHPLTDSAPAPEELQQAVEMIDAAKSVAILVGHGARSAIAEIAALAEKLQAPLIHTFRAKDMLPYDHPHWIGGVGLIGGTPGIDALHNSELMLMLGSDYPYSEFLPTKSRIVQIDQRGFVLGRRAAVTLGMTAAVKPAVEQLLAKVQGKTDQSFFKNAGDARHSWNAMLDRHAAVGRAQKKIKPQTVARRLGELAADDAVFVVDTGVVTLWCGNWLRQSGRQRILASFNNAAVGTALGQANGVQALDRKRQVVVAAGDGGFTMLLGEFMTSVEHKLPLKVVVFNNREWGLVHLEMEEAGLPAFEGSNFPNMDFAAFARACGAEGFTAQTPDQLDDALRSLLAAPGPAILNVMIDASELPIMPHIKLDQIWRFGLAKVKESMLSMKGG